MPKLPLLTRTILALAAVAMLPLAVAFWLLTGINREGMTKQILRTHAVAASTAAQRIGAFVSARQATVRGIADADVLESGGDQVAAREFFEATLRGDSSIAAVAAYAPSGAEILRVQRKESAHEMRSTLDAAARDARPVAVVAGERNLWLVVSADLAGGGKARLVANGSPLVGATRAKELGPEAQIGVLAGDQLLFGSAESLDAFPPEMLAAGRTSRIDGSGVFGSGASQAIGAHAAVDGTGWVVLSRQPARVARSVESEMRRGSLVAVVVAALLAAVAAVLSWFTVVRPLRKLASAQQRLVGPAAKPAASEIEQLREGLLVLERRQHDQEDLGKVFLGRYQVLDLLGEGGMGNVFRGWDPRLQRSVALKTIRFSKEVAPSAERMVLGASLVREAVTIARFNHPNIVSVYDAEETEGGAFVAMELVDGMSLEKYIARRGVLTTDDTTLIGLAVTNALAAAHAQGLVHRDVKPPNVLLDRTGAIKVSDFGLAELCNAIRADGFVFGTPGYIAPECVTGGLPTPTSDLFSLGVLLYDCLTGRNPFRSKTVAKTLRSTVIVAPVPPRVLNDLVDKELESLVMRLLEKVPSNRFASAAEVASILDARVAAGGLRWMYRETSAGDEESREAAGHAGFIPTLRERPTIKLAG